MTPRRNAFQEDLFETPRTQELQRRVKELDIKIARALKKNEYEQAKALTHQQEQIIQELVSLSEGNEASK